MQATRLHVTAGNWLLKQATRLQPEFGTTMNDNHGHLDKDAHLPRPCRNARSPGRSCASPLGWSIKGRLLGAAAASVLLWLAVVWALGWLVEPMMESIVSRRSHPGL